MSGGHFNYLHDRIVGEVFDWEIDVYDFADDSQRLSASRARTLNPLNDVELSEMLYDIACVLMAHDYWRSGDCDVDCYNKAKQRFKGKWFGKTQKERIESQVEKATEQLRKDIKEMFETEGAPDD